MFATSWLLTAFTRICSNLNIVYELWEIIIFERDKYILFYIAVALLKINKAKLMALT